MESFSLKGARTDIQSKDRDSLLALEIASSSKRMQVDWSPKDSVEELLVLLRERLVVATKEGHVAELASLLLVAAIGDEPVAKLLCQAGLTSVKLTELVLHLLKHGAKVCERNLLGLTPVHVTAEKANYQALQMHIPKLPTLSYSFL
ncbi:uncharacterized protein A4U43_C08F1140 [Asparagus officinalis]|nr:uncharacterized protein A4U43_C08F1140 [Asparagus officinalis]